MASFDARLDALSQQHRLPEAASGQIRALLSALDAQPDPHTTVSTPGKALDVHVADALVALDLDEVRQARAIADLGAGAGFPGLPLAIALPEARVDLVESASRKTALIERLAAATGITNARAIHARAEEHAAGEGKGVYDLVTVRAVASLNVLVEYAAPLLTVGGHLVAWKGTPDRQEINDGEAAASLVGLKPNPTRQVSPFEGATGLNLYVYSKVRETPDRYPRRAGMARKRPLVAGNRQTQS